MKAGADVVGGLDPCAMIVIRRAIATRYSRWRRKYGKPLDIHLHEPGEMGAFSFELIFGAPAPST